MKFARKVKRRVRALGRRIRRAVRGRYDAAQTTANNRKHWANADTLSADAANSLTVRQTLRTRARYEVANNTYARGIVSTLANDVIGCGPRLQLLTEQRDENNLVERHFATWAAEIRLAQKLRTARMAIANDGEAFLLFANNPRLRHPVKLDLVGVECDRVATPQFTPRKGLKAVDGIVFDEFGNPEVYHVLKQHPGDTSWFESEMAFDPVPASRVIHLFRQDRAEQHRGIPEITSALPLFAQLRRYTLATVDAAETAANLSGVIYSDGAAESDTFDEQRDDSAATPFEPIELDRNMWTTLPFGYKIGQMKAEQPSATYEMFKREILNEIARCVNMPYNIAACNSSGYNFASGRLDHQTYDRAIAIDRNYFEIVALERILTMWLDEAVLIENFLPQGWRLMGVPIPPAHEWFWTNRPHVDPAKEANAQAMRLKNKTTTLAHEYALQGKDWEQELRQRARERALIRELGMDDAPDPETADLNEDDEEKED